MDIVSVKFQSKKNPEEFSGREYSYFTQIPLEIGDVVVAPTKGGGSAAIVSRTGILESELTIDAKLLRTIESKIPMGCETPEGISF